MKGGDILKFFQRVKYTAYQAVQAWKGKTYDFSSWSGRSFFGVDNSTLATNETIFSAITRLSNSMSSLPLKLYKNYEIQNTEIADLLTTEPNPNMTGFDFINILESSRNETGNGYAIIERDIRGQPERLEPINSNNVTPVIEKNTRELWYEIRGEDGNKYYMHNADMIHVKHIRGSGGIVGINPIKVLSNANEFDKAVREFSLKEMQSASSSFILSYGANVDKDKRQRVVEDFKRFYRDNGGILFKEPGVEIKEMERKYIPADTLTSERITRSRVANVYNMPVTMLNDAEGQSYSSNEQLMIMFVQLTLMPIVRQYEQEFKRKLLTTAERKLGFYFKFNEKALLRADVATQADYYTKAIRSGWMKQDEVRQSEDLPPVGGNADKLWVSGDLYPIDTPINERKSSNSNSNNND